MTLLFAILFGAGVAGFAYTRLGRRVGYGNSQNVWLLMAVVFIIATLIFYTAFATFFSS